MTPHIKDYIERNKFLLEEDIVKFVMLLPGPIENTEELYFMLKNARINIPHELTYMVAILDIYNRCSYTIREQLENILIANGANDDDSGEYGFLTGMSEEQLRKTYDSFKQIFKKHDY